MLENSLCDLWAQPKAFQSSDDPIAAKHGAEPGNSCVGVLSLRVTDDHHVNVGKGAVKPMIELIIRATDGAWVSALVVSTLNDCQQFVECFGRSRLAAVAGNRQ